MSGETVKTIYPSSFEKVMMNQIAELLKSISRDQFDLVFDTFTGNKIPENKTIRRLAKEIYLAMNKSCIKYAKVKSEEDIFIKLSYLHRQCIEEIRPGHGSPLPIVKLSYERSEVFYE